MRHARLYNSLLNTPWLLTPDMLSTGLAIVQSDSGGDRERAEELRERRAHRPAALAMRTGEALPGSSGITVREGIAHMAVIGPLVR